MRYQACKYQRLKSVNSWKQTLKMVKYDRALLRKQNETNLNLLRGNVECSLKNPLYLISIK